MRIHCPVVVEYSFNTFYEKEFKSPVLCVY